MKVNLLVILCFWLVTGIYGQSLEDEILREEQLIIELNTAKVSTQKKLEELKLKKIQQDLISIGFPKSNFGEQVVQHQAMVLGYDEKHEQARWVMHMVLPDIEEGNTSRTNDFREDSLVTTGTAVKADYWYSGYDRGHLAPSADFRWSPIALSESYYYSNMSPQLPELNREKWAELENAVRDYVLYHNEPVYVITGPVLHDSLPTMKNEGRANEVSIPELYYKIVLDITGEEKRGVAFLIPNGDCTYPIMSYATSIDVIERRTGLRFYSNLPEDLASKLKEEYIEKDWQVGVNDGNVQPINPTTLPKGKINTVQAQYNIGTKSCVCGTVVSTKYSEKSGAVFLNLDKKFPNQIFSVTIWKDARANFSYLPEEELKGKKVCLTGRIENKRGTPTINITNEKKIEVIGEDY
ncbi:MAG: DNA/RNA non-specific endonuclease [Flavobacteriales bacterium]|nr:DNA/RNA non-specific endonuclease [Flavobacteriales bacterium]